MTQIARLQAILVDIAERSELAIAFSGGLDSRFLAFVALKSVQNKKRIRLLHVTGPHMAAAESAKAERWASEQHAVFAHIAVNPLALPCVRANSRERCYHCKRGLFQELLRHAGSAVLVDGSNASDTHGYRPGLKALAELGIRSPLMEAGLRKTQIHTLAAELELSEPWQRARPCLLTRFPYDSPIDEPTLRELEMMEARVEQVLGSGPLCPDFRLRVVPGGGFLLQIQSTDGVDDRAVAASVRQALPALRVELVEAVSGYHDRREYRQR